MCQACKARFEEVHANFCICQLHILSTSDQSVGCTLLLQEIFTRATAHEYTWCEDTGTDATPLFLSDNDSSVYAPIQLTREEVQQQVVLVKNGLLGRGATALVFKCKWPSRFGSNTLLAAKVLKDGYELDINTLQSFHYEATVLASFK
jgi:hypothetical protein